MDPVRPHLSHFVFHTCWNLVPGDVRWCRIIIHIKGGRVWKGPAFFAVGGGTSLSPFCTDCIWNRHIYHFCLLNNICTKKGPDRLLELIGHGWIFSLSLFFFSIRQSPEASISLITESFHLNGRLCIVRTKGRAATEEVLDRGMDWASAIRMSGTAGSG